MYNALLTSGTLKGRRMGEGGGGETSSLIRLSWVPSGKGIRFVYWRPPFKPPPKHTSVLNPFAFAFSVAGTPSSVRISSANERGRTDAEHALMNEPGQTSSAASVQPSGMLALTWPAFCDGTVVRTRLLICENT